MSCELCVCAVSVEREVVVNGAVARVDGRRWVLCVSCERRWGGVVLEHEGGGGVGNSGLVYAVEVLGWRGDD